MRTKPGRQLPNCQQFKTLSTWCMVAGARFEPSDSTSVEQPESRTTQMGGPFVLPKPRQQHPDRTQIKTINKESEQR